MKIGFLNGKLDEEIYMRIPLDFEDKREEEKVWKRKKSSYGLRQSPRAWIKKFSVNIKKFGYDQGQADHTLFIEHSGSRKKSVLVVYVDDFIMLELTLMRLKTSRNV